MASSFKKQILTSIIILSAPVLILQSCAKLEHGEVASAEVNDTFSVNTDCDGDGISDADEVKQGTNPSKADTDNDGLNDYAEIHTHLTNPTLSDTDGDGLTDGAEVNTFQTNPLVVDTDGDGVNDGLEVSQGTNPLVNTDFNVQNSQPLTCN
jgi:hypothetical protein